MDLSLAGYGGEASLQMCASLDGLRSLLGYMPDLRTFNLCLLWCVYRCYCCFIKGSHFQAPFSWKGQNDYFLDTPKSFLRVHHRRRKGLLISNSYRSVDSTPGPFFTYSSIFPENGARPDMTPFSVQNLAIGMKDLLDAVSMRMSILQNLILGTTELLDGTSQSTLGP